MPKPIKIAYIIDTIVTPSAGTEKQLLYLLNGLDHDKVQPYLICFYQSDWMKTQNFKFPVYYLNLRSLFSFDFYRSYKQLKKLHAQEQFDIAQTFFRDGNIFGTIAAKLCKIKVIISSRRNIGYWHNKMHISILRFLEKMTTYYIANSQAAVDMTHEIENAPLDKFKIIYNGLDLDKFREIDSSVRTAQRNEWNFADSDIVIGTVANLRPVKRLDTIVEAAKVLTENHANLKFVLIGEGSERENLNNLINKYGLQNNFLLPGSSENIPSVLSAFDIAVLPSSNESFSNSLIEYMAAGLPISATKVGGNSEAIEHNKNGLLYNLDDNNGLTDTLRILIEEKAKTEELAKNAQEKAFNEYSIEKMISNHEAYYNSLVR